MNKKILSGNKKRVLDACCGAKMFWFDKNNQDVVFQDVRRESHTLCDGRKLVISPDVLADFRNMPYEDECFFLVVFDPPHLRKIGTTSLMGKKYGRLPDDWKKMIREGFDECMRVLKPNGTLIFKWNERDIPIRTLIGVIGREPLFGYTTKSGGHTIWMAFMK